MALYDSAAYRSGAQGYVTSKAQAAQLVAANATTDPAPQTGVDDLMGFVDNPSAQRDEGIQPVQAPGSMRTVCHTRGARTYGINARFLVGDGTFLTYAARDHSDPDKTGTVMGLPMRTYEFGATSEFGAAQADAEQAIDALINLLRVEYREGQPLSATVDIWPAVVLDTSDGVVPKVAYTPMSCPVLHWCHLDWLVGGVDYHNILRGCTFSLNNNLIRDGVRKQFGAIGSEEKISRTPYIIKPGVEDLGLRHQWRDKLPDALLNGSDWSTLTMRAEEPGDGAGRRYLQIQIAHNFLQRWSREGSDARNMMTWAGDSLSYECAITAGTT